MTSSRFPPPPARFVPVSVDPGRWADVDPLFTELENRPLESAADLERWLFDTSELLARLAAEEARRYIAMTCDTADPARKERYLAYCREVDPKVKISVDKLDRIYLDSPHRAALPRPRYDVFDRFKQSEAEIFLERNIPFEALEAEAVTRYTEIVGSLTVDLDGREVTLQRASLELEEKDRDRREAVWRRIAERRARESDAVDEIFEKLLFLRESMAQNLELSSYRDLRFRRLRRFDYGVPECEAFHDAVRRVVVPCVARMNEERRRALGVERLRPWDFEVDPLGGTPFRPFDSHEALCDLSRRLFEEVDPEFARDFSALESADLLDLISRPNKAPGGYQYFLEDVRLPFIFANAVGTHDDVQTLLHEGGHAFHSLALRDEGLLVYRDPPMEFCEVASMSMEFLGLEHLEKVYPAAEARRQRRLHIEKTLRLFPWIATVDAFQHWLYTYQESETGNPMKDWRRAWVRLRREFSPDIDWSGLEKYHELEWHRQGHIFRQPFYYIEYGIALLGALQLRRVARDDRARAVAQYRAGLSPGGSMSLADLFKTADLRFEFGFELMREYIEPLFEEWQTLFEEERRGAR